MTKFVYFYNLVIRRKVWLC